MNKLIYGMFIFIITIFSSITTFTIGQIDIKPKFGMDCTLSISDISPRTISTNQRFTVAYKLKCKIAMNIDYLKVKVGLFVQNRLKKTQDLSRYPNNQELRYFISTQAPENPGRYHILLKVVRSDANPATARGNAVFAYARSTIEVQKGAPDLVITSFRVYNPLPRIKNEKRYLYFPYRVQVKNQGSEKAGKFAIGIKDEDLDFTYFRLGTKGCTQSDLLPGQLATLAGEAELLLTEGLIKYKYRLKAKADIPVGEFVGENGAVLESKEDNNFSRTITVISPYAKIKILSCGKHAYRGSEIELFGGFGHTIGERKVAMFQGGALRAYTEILDFKPSKIKIRIPDRDSIVRGLNYQIFLVKSLNGATQVISNPADLYICQPLSITHIESAVKDVGDYLVNEKNIILTLQKDDRCSKIKWYIEKKDSDHRTPVKTNKLNRNTVGIFPNLALERGEDVTLCLLRVYDACLGSFDNSEGTALVAKRICKLHKRWFNPLGFSMFIIPCAKIHIDSNGSYIRMAPLGMLCDPEPTEGEVFPIELQSSYEIPTSGCDYKVWFRDINCILDFNHHLIFRKNKMILKLNFETGGADEVGLDYSSCSGEVPDIHLHHLKVDITCNLYAENGVINPSSFFRVGNVTVDLDADMNYLPDWLVELFIGEMDPLFRRYIRKELLRTLRSNRIKQSMYDSLMKGFQRIAGSTAQIVTVGIKYHTESSKYKLLIASIKKTS